MNQLLGNLKNSDIRPTRMKYVFCLVDSQTYFSDWFWVTTHKVKSSDFFIHPKLSYLSTSLWFCVRPVTSTCGLPNFCPQFMRVFNTFNLCLTPPIRIKDMFNILWTSHTYFNGIHSVHCDYTAHLQNQNMHIKYK